VHVETAAKIAGAATQAGIRRFVHVSGIGANTASSSPYIRSRGEGEAAVQTVFPGAVIVRPAVMFASDDAFLTTILRMLRFLPAYPIFGNGRTRLQPVYVDDVAAAIAQILRQSQKPYSVYELAGPAGLLLRGVVANHCAYRGSAANVGAHAICHLECIGRRCRDASAAATHPQSGRTASERLPGFRALGISPRSLEDELEAIVRHKKTGVLLP
jgi:nucleoside-diphosphate-sugar epimerase